MAKTGHTGLSRIIKATGYSWQGIKACFIHEAAFRQELLLAIILTPLAFWLANTTTELVLLIASVMLVLIVEILNSAIEAVVDRFGDQLHELSGRAKDLGSAAVAFSLINMLIVWLLIIFY
ncbi:MAG: diacylglycerol kinase [Gammaproteobacteria bacterium]|nr:diacylglycerol kinase [Gammaproteobacteria bacterium]MCW8909008.1 diacylglycerol kinase [Gammaproteobacteria bacterium]MCW9004365.1 diacylglycerol kinase [Gammaproteobacteria bacterium]MCW9056163.1 diacylglycerol kinase [Gammaproteobacteria bacterium]